MAYFSVNKVTRTAVLHKEGCAAVKKAQRRNELGECGCGVTGAHEEHHWYCQEHATIEGITEFVGIKRFWVLLVCEKCFKE